VTRNTQEKNEKKKTKTKGENAEQHNDQGKPVKPSVVLCPVCVSFKRIYPVL
jgi:DNA-directed RNA polymerase subunit M/transcription elongation factor TFIIS